MFETVVTLIEAMYIPLIFVLCLVLGYILKHWINDVENKYIPTILTIVGAIAACFSSGDITLELIVSGAISGLASTGMHQAFKQFVNKE